MPCTETDLAIMILLASLSIINPFLMQAGADAAGRDRVLRMVSEAQTQHTVRLEAVKAAAVQAAARQAALKQRLAAAANSTEAARSRAADARRAEADAMRRQVRAVAAGAASREEQVLHEAELPQADAQLAHMRARLAAARDRAAAYARLPAQADHLMGGVTQAMLEMEALDAERPPLLASKAAAELRAEHVQITTRRSTIAAEVARLLTRHLEAQHQLKPGAGSGGGAGAGAGAGPSGSSSLSLINRLMDFAHHIAAAAASAEATADAFDTFASSCSAALQVAASGLDRSVGVASSSTTLVISESGFASASELDISASDIEPPKEPATHIRASAAADVTVRECSGPLASARQALLEARGVLCEWLSSYGPLAEQLQQLLEAAIGSYGVIIDSEYYDKQAASGTNDGGEGVPTTAGALFAALRRCITRLAPAPLRFASVVGPAVAGAAALLVGVEGGNSDAVRSAVAELLSRAESVAAAVVGDSNRIFAGSGNFANVFGFRRTGSATGSLQAALRSALQALQPLVEVHLPGLNASEASAAATLEDQLQSVEAAAAAAEAAATAAAASLPAEKAASAAEARALASCAANPAVAAAVAEAEQSSAHIAELATRLQSVMGHSKALAALADGLVQGMGADMSLSKHSLFRTTSGAFDSGAGDAVATSLSGGAALNHLSLADLGSTGGSSTAIAALRAAPLLLQHGADATAAVSVAEAQLQMLMSRLTVSGPGAQAGSGTVSRSSSAGGAHFPASEAVAHGNDATAAAADAAPGPSAVGMPPLLPVDDAAADCFATQPAAPFRVAAQVAAAGSGGAATRAVSGSIAAALVAVRAMRADRHDAAASQAAAGRAHDGVKTGALLGGLRRDSIAAVQCLDTLAQCDMEEQQAIQAAQIRAAAESAAIATKVAAEAAAAAAEAAKQAVKRDAEAAARAAASVASVGASASTTGAGSAAASKSRPGRGIRSAAAALTPDSSQEDGGAGENAASAVSARGDLSSSGAALSAAYAARMRAASGVAGAAVSSSSGLGDADDASGTSQHSGHKRRAAALLQAEAAPAAAASALASTAAQATGSSKRRAVSAGPGEERRVTFNLAGDRASAGRYGGTEAAPDGRAALADTSDDDVADAGRDAAPLATQVIAPKARSTVPASDAGASKLKPKMQSAGCGDSTGATASGNENRPHAVAARKAPSAAAAAVVVAASAPTGITSAAPVRPRDSRNASRVRIGAGLTDEDAFAAVLGPSSSTTAGAGAGSVAPAGSTHSATGVEAAADPFAVLDNSSRSGSRRVGPGSLVSAASGPAVGVPVGGIDSAAFMSAADGSLSEMTRPHTGGVGHSAVSSVAAHATDAGGAARTNARLAGSSGVAGRSDKTTAGISALSATATATGSKRPLSSVAVGNVLITAKTGSDTRAKAAAAAAVSASGASEDHGFLANRGVAGGSSGSHGAPSSKTARLSLSHASPHSDESAVVAASSRGRSVTGTAKGPRGLGSLSDSSDGDDKDRASSRRDGGDRKENILSWTAPTPVHTDAAPDSHLRVSIGKAAATAAAPKVVHRADGPLAWMNLVPDLDDEEAEAAGLGVAADEEQGQEEELEEADDEDDGDDGASVGSADLLFSSAFGLGKPKPKATLNVKPLQPMPASKPAVAAVAAAKLASAKPPISQFTASGKARAAPQAAAAAAVPLAGAPKTVPNPQAAGRALSSSAGAVTSGSAARGVGAPITVAATPLHKAQPPGGAAAALAAAVSGSAHGKAASSGIGASGSGASTIKIGGSSGKSAAPGLLSGTPRPSTFGSAAGAASGAESFDVGGGPSMRVTPALSMSGGSSGVRAPLAGKSGAGNLGPAPASALPVAPAAKPGLPAAKSKPAAPPAMAVRCAGVHAARPAAGSGAGRLAALLSSGGFGGSVMDVGGGAGAASTSSQASDASFGLFSGGLFR